MMKEFNHVSIDCEQKRASFEALFIHCLSWLFFHNLLDIDVFFTIRDYEYVDTCRLSCQ